MVVEIDKKLAEDALPTSHVEDAREKVRERRDSDSANQILLNSLRQRFEKAVNAKRPVQEMQLKSLQQVITGDYGNEDPGDEQQDHTVNLVKTLVRNIRARIIDASSAPVAVPRKPDDWYVANMMDATMKYILDANDWKERLEQIIFDACVKGAGFTREQWDPDMGEDGNVNIDVIDALRFFPGSSSKDIQDQGMVFVLHSEPLHKVTERFPEAELEAAASAGAPFPHFGNEDFMFDHIPLSAFSERRFERFESEGIKVLIAGGGSGDPSQFRQFEDNVNYVEAFYKYPKGHDLREKFPNGRRTFFTEVAVLEDQIWKDEERLPYTKYPIETEGDSFWPNSLVSQLSSPQRIVNKLGNIATDAAERSANAPLMTPIKGGLDEHEYVSEMDDKVLHVNPMAVRATQHIEPPKFPSEVVEVMQLYKGLTEELAGVQDISQGKVPGRLESGSAIDLLQEAAQTLIRHYIRNVNTGVRDLGMNLQELIQNRFKKERVIRTGDKRHNQFITLNKKVEVQKAKKEIAQAADRQGVQEGRKKLAQQRVEQRIDEDVNSTVAQVTINDPTVVPVDIRIASGGDKLSRAGRVKEAFEAFDRNAIDERELLRVMNWDNKDEVLERIEEKRILAQRVEGLQERLENVQSSIREFLSQADVEATQQLQAAIQQQQNSPRG